MLTFAGAIWNGSDFDVALKSAAAQGLKVGGSTFITAVLAGQISKAGMNSLLVGSSEAIVRMIGPKASAVLVNAFRSGTNIYGAAAMKSAAKLLRGNAIHRCCVVCSPLDWRCWKYLCWSDLRRSTLQKSGQYSVYGRWRWRWVGCWCRRRGSFWFRGTHRGYGGWRSAWRTGRCFWWRFPCLKSDRSGFGPVY